eukprot:XP_001706622.1 Hypothetical protein GL50803_35788 [Giardia lamblia ATCC 50803]
MEETRLQCFANSIGRKRRIFYDTNSIMKTRVEHI